MHSIRPSRCGGQVGTGVRALLGAARLLGCRFSAGTLIRHLKLLKGTKSRSVLIIFRQSRFVYEHEMAQTPFNLTMNLTTFKTGRRDHS